MGPRLIAQAAVCTFRLCNIASFLTVDGHSSGSSVAVLNLLFNETPDYAATVFTAEGSSVCTENGTIMIVVGCW